MLRLGLSAGPPGEFVQLGAGILIRPPFDRVDVGDNSVRRQQQPGGDPDASAWNAVVIAAPFRPPIGTVGGIGTVGTVGTVGGTTGPVGPVGTVGTRAGTVGTVGTIGRAGLVAAAAPIGAVGATRPIIDTRLRFEDVDQDPMADSAEALTLRARLGFETGKAWSTTLLAEGELVWPLTDNYNNTINGNPRYPTVADPESYEINRLQLVNTSLAHTAVTLGRQHINLDDQRFVGNVG